MPKLGYFSADDLYQALSFAELARALEPGSWIDAAFRHSAATNVATVPSGLARGRNLFGPGQSPPMTSSPLGRHPVRGVSSVVLNNARFSPASLSVIDSHLRLFREGIDNVEDPARLATFDDTFARGEDGSAHVTDAALTGSAEQNVIALPLCSHGFHNFGHFHIDGLPGVLLHVQALRGVENIRVVGPELAAWQRELLDALGLLTLYLPVTRPTVFRKVLTTTMLSMHVPYPTRFIRPVFDALRFVFGTPAQPGPERVFLSRGAVDGNARVLRNRAPVEAMLTARGFHIAQPHLMTVRDQVQLMASARLVVGEVGAGLISFGYCDPGTKVLEIQPDSFVDGWPRAQSFLLGQQWHLYLARSERAEGPATVAPSIAYDIAPDDLAAALDAIEAGGPAAAAVAQAAAVPVSYLLSYHGTLICRDSRSGAVSQRAVDDLADDARPLTIVVDRTRRNSLANDDAIAVTSGDLRGFAVRWTADGSRVAVSRGGLFLCADQDGRVTLDRAVADVWEQFALLSAADLAGLRAILAHDWMMCSSRRLVSRAAVRLAGEYRLWLGDDSIELQHRLPLPGAPAPFRLGFAAAGGHMEEAALYRPLICLCVPQTAAMLEDLARSLRALLEVARYGGHVHLIADMPADTIVPALCARVPGLDPARLSIQTIVDAGRLGRVARFELADWPQAATFQPILIADFDAVFDAGLAPMLAAIAASDRICLPSGASPAAGLLGVPNLVAHAAGFARLRRAAAGEPAAGASDRSDFDFDLLTRYATPDDAPASTVPASTIPAPGLRQAVIAFHNGQYESALTLLRAHERNHGADDEVVHRRGQILDRLNPPRLAPASILWRGGHGGWEQDWLDSILPRLPAIAADTPPADLADRALLVVDQRITAERALFYRDAYARGCRILLLHLSDEAFEDDHRAYRWCRSVFRNYFSPAMRDYGHVSFLALGPKSGFADGRPPLPVEQRRHVWSFAGDPGKTTRAAMLAAMRAVEGGHEHLTSGFAAADALATDAYREMMRQSVFVPCPQGYVSLDSFRVYEALEAGCIPIVERRAGFDYFTELLGPHPFPSVTRWEEAVSLIDHLQRHGLTDALAAECRRWWTRYKSLVGQRIAAALPV